MKCDVCLIERGMKCDDRCQLCGFEGESVNHVLFSCHLARICWALSNIPSPRGGFSVSSIYENISYLLRTRPVGRYGADSVRSWPWLLWFLWKNRNSFIFEGKSFEAEEIVVKAKQEAEAWFLAQQVQSGMEIEEEKVVSATVLCSLQNVPVGWVQCEFAMDWASRGESMGASWIVKDEKGKVLEHSRRAFVEVGSLTEAKLQLWLWVLESMRSLKKKKVRFVSSFGDLIEAIEKPSCWPALQFEVGEIKRELQAFEAWELRIGSSNTIRCASFIAQSVRNLGLTQSYVAAGHPRWLDHIYANARSASGGN